MFFSFQDFVTNGHFVIKALCELASHVNYMGTSSISVKNVTVLNISVYQVLLNSVI